MMRGQYAARHATERGEPASNDPDDIARAAMAAQRTALEEALLRVAVEPAAMAGRHPRAVLFPQLDPSASWDDADVIDWSDVPNDGWGTGATHASHSGAGGGGTAVGAVAASAALPLNRVRPWGSVFPVRGLTADARRRTSTPQLRARVKSGASAPGTSPCGGPERSRHRHACTDLWLQTSQPVSGADARTPGASLFPCDGRVQSADITEPVEFADAAWQALEGDGMQQTQRQPPLPPQQQQQHGTSCSAGETVAKQKELGSPRGLRFDASGRWQPPSRAEAEALMMGSMESGSDEGV